jgi:hypothetical protein
MKCGPCPWTAIFFLVQGRSDSDAPLTSTLYIVLFHSLYRNGMLRLYMLMLPKSSHATSKPIIIWPQNRHSQSLISDYFAVRLVRSMPIVPVEVSLFVQGLFIQFIIILFILPAHTEYKGYRSYTAVFIYFMACMCMQPRHAHTYYSQLKLQQEQGFELKGTSLSLIVWWHS